MDLNCQECDNENDRIEGGGQDHDRCSSIGDTSLKLRLNRRDFLSSGSVAAASATSVLGFDPPLLEAHAASVSTDDTTGIYTPEEPSRKSPPKQLEMSAVVPYSSVRRYKTLVLANGLRVLLVSDKRILQSASAALTIGRAGQFSDPNDLPGLAHLMEHMILASTADRTQQSFLTGRRFSSFLPPNNNVLPAPRSQDFEEWLADHEGSSNGYTAYDNVCFHFFVSNLYFQQALELFASLFVPANVERVCRGAKRNLDDDNNEVLAREVNRVDSELDLDRVDTQAYFLTKDFVNVEHPYSRFGLGNRETLEQNPRDAGIDVSSRLVDFFHRYYQPSEAVLVVLGTQDLATLARWVNPFVATLSRHPKGGGVRREGRQGEEQLPQPLERYYPGRFLQGGIRLKQMVLVRKQQSQLPPASGREAATATGELLTMEWILNLDYTNAIQLGEPVVTGTQIAFLLSQILGRRSSGSLYFFLLRRGWVPSGSVPKITVPVDVSGFQLLKLEINLTLEGFLNRPAVVVALYDCLDAFRTQEDSFSVSRVLVTSWATKAKLFGYTLANRPPDVIELAQDAQIYGTEAVASIGGGNSYRFPSPEDRTAIRVLSKSLSNTLAMMSDPDTAVVIVTAGPVALSESNLPKAESKKWATEPLTRGRFLYEDMLGLASRIEELVLTRLVDREELRRPVLNPLIPLKLRPARVLGPTNEATSGTFLQRLGVSAPNDQAKSLVDTRGDWFIAFPNKPILPMPRGPPEPTCRCAFVVQLLSSRPARAGIRQAAQAELFKISFDSAFSDLAQLGAPGGLAYDISYNKFGLRIAVLGLSQNVGSYTRRLCRRIVEHSNILSRGPEIFPRTVTNAAVRDVNMARGVSLLRKRILVSSIRRSTAYDSAAEGIAFFRSCEGAVCFAQGDMLSNEVQDLAQEVRDIFDKIMKGSPQRSTKPAFPDIGDLVYQPVWKPRFGSPCGLAGVPLISDACGRVPR